MKDVFYSKTLPFFLTLVASLSLISCAVTVRKPGAVASPSSACIYPFSSSQYSVVSGENLNLTLTSAPGRPIFNIDSGSGTLSSSIYSAPSSSGVSVLSGSFAGSTCYSSVVTVVPRKIYGGRSSMCALLSDGRLQCWGQNQNNHVSANTFSADLASPTVISSLTNVSDAAVGAQHTCALKSDGTVWCWGYGGDGEIGNGANLNVSTPTQVTGITTATQIVAGGYHNCALLSDATVKCWGRGTSGEIGNSASANVNAPQAVTGISTATQITAIYSSTCALLSNATVKCWGAGTSGQLGNSASANSNTPVSVTGIATGSKLAVGAYSSANCVILSDGSLKCWGSNSSKQLGDTTQIDRNAPVSVLGLPVGSVVSEAVTGQYHTCAVLSTGSIYCWGTNFDGQSGGSSWPSPVNYYVVPQAVSNISQATKITAVGAGSCILDLGNNIYCWGDNRYGDLGRNGHQSVYAPTSASQITTNISGGSAGTRYSCWYDSGGSVYCVGDNYYGNLGNGSTTSSTTIVSPSLTGITAISSGVAHTCATKSNGAVYCWGYNGSKQLGDNTVVDSSTPIAVSGLLGVSSSVSAGGFHTCSNENNTAYCWGRNSSGQIGNGSTGASVGTPYAVVTPQSVSTISAGAFHTCATLSNNAVYCWGSNSSGALGDGTIIDRSSPTMVTGGILSATKVVTGENFSCVLLSSGAVYCWGYNGDGELGDGTFSSSTSPVQVAGITTATDIAASRKAACALLTGGSVVCWGDNRYLQLGINSSGIFYTSNIQTVSNLSGMTYLVGGAYNNHFCAGNGTGAPKCWGDNTWGQTGNNDPAGTLTPIRVSPWSNY